MNPALRPAQPAHALAPRALLFRPRLCSSPLSPSPSGPSCHVRRPKELRWNNSAIFYLRFPCSLPSALCILLSSLWAQCLKRSVWPSGTTSTNLA